MSVSESGLLADPSQEDTSYCFKWSNYQNHLSDVVRQLLDEKCMLDVTLIAAGKRIQAHRLVLCACSTLFQDILSQVNEEQATIILSDIAPQEVKSIVEFCYNGEVRIPVENINNLLDAAHSLKICGLMEIDGLDELEISNDKSEESYVFHELSQDEDESQNESSEFKKQKSSDDESDQKLRRRRKSVCKKDYTDEMLAAAIEDIKAGKSLLDAAAKNHIPRSTLYMRAKLLKIPLNPARNEYTHEDMKGAIDAVMGGSSLQQASDCFGIPKTVLWRRIQKEGYQTPKHENRKLYGAEKREAAVKALERGETLTKVAREYQIPKTTLFRDKARLVHQGKLPVSFWKKRKTDNDDQKRSRLEEAVAACINGKMSQAAASVTFQIPKTTIWRRLQKELTKKDGTKKISKNIVSNKEEIDSEFIKTEELTEADFDTYAPDDSDMITYIDDSNEMSDDQVIILATGDVNELNLPNSRSLVVVQEGSDDNYISCELELDDNTTFVTKS